MKRTNLNARLSLSVMLCALLAAVAGPALAQSPPASCTHPAPPALADDIKVVWPDEEVTVAFDTSRDNPSVCRVTPIAPATLGTPTISAIQQGRRQSFTVKAPSTLDSGSEGTQQYRLTCDYASGQPDNFCVSVPYEIKPLVVVEPDPITDPSGNVTLAVKPQHEDRVDACDPGTNAEDCGCQVALPEYHSGQWAVDTTSAGAWKQTDKTSVSEGLYTFSTPLDNAINGLSASSILVMRNDKCGDLPVRARCDYGSMPADENWIAGNGSVAFWLDKLPLDLSADSGQDRVDVVHIKEQFALKLTRNVDLKRCWFEAGWETSTESLSTALLDNHPDMGSFANAVPGSATMTELPLNELSIRRLETGGTPSAADTVRLIVNCEPHGDRDENNCLLPDVLSASLDIGYAPDSSFDSEIRIKKVTPAEITEGNQSVKVKYLRKGSASACWFRDPGTEKLLDGSNGLTLVSTAAKVEGNRRIGVDACAHNNSTVQFMAGCTFTRGTGTIEMVDAVDVPVKIPAVQLAMPTIATGTIGGTEAAVQITSTEWGSPHRLEYRQRDGNSWGDWQRVDIPVDQGRSSGDQVTETLRGLSPETEYEVRVQAVAADACNTDSATTASVSFTTIKPVTGEVSVLINKPANREVTQVGYKIKVTYISTGNPESCRVQSHSGTWEDVPRLAVPGGSSRKFKYKSPATLPATDLVWTYTVECTYSGGVKEQGSNSVTIKSLLPPRPERPVLVESTSSNLKVRTNDVPGATGYTWRISLDEIFTSADRTETSTNGELTVDRLESGTRYHIDVRAENSTGDGEYSEHLSADTLPSAPVLTGRTSTSLTVRRSPVAGATYRWRISENEVVSDSDYMVPSVPADSHEFTLTDSMSGRLMPNTTYYIDVRTEGPGGNGSYSDDLTATTLPSPPSTPWRTGRTPTSLTLQTNAVAGATEYRWRISADADITDDDISVTGNRQVTLRHVKADGVRKVLEPDTPYHMDVRVESPHISDYSPALASRTAPRIGLAVSASSIDMDESANYSITVRLDDAPHEDVTVDLAWAELSSSDLSITSPKPANGTHRLTFTPGNWNINQTVIIHAAADSDYVRDEGTLLLTPGGGATSPGHAVSIPVNVSDPLPVRSLVISPARVEMNEGDSPRDITVKLDGDPHEDVPVDVTWKNGSSGDISISSPPSVGGRHRLTFDSSNWNAPQTVTISAVADPDHENDHGTLGLTPGGTATDASRARSVSVSVIDSPPRELVVVPDPITMNEGATNSGITVNLNGNPYEDVTVTAASDNPDVTLVGFPHIFNGSNWDADYAFAIIVAADEDPLDETASITLTTTGVFTNGTKVVDVSISDVTPPPVLVFSPTSVEMNEGTVHSITVKLDGDPHEEVPVDVSWERGSSSDLSVVRAHRLTFDSSNWNIEQTVTVRATVDQGHQPDSGTLVLTPRGAATDASRERTVTVNVNDPQARNLVISPVPVEMNEGTVHSITVKLDGDPYENVPVVIAWGTGSSRDLSITAPSSVGGAHRLTTFNSSNWNDPQTITVHAATDSGYQLDSGVLELTPQGVATNASRAEEVTVNVNDPQARDLVVNPDPAEMNEGTTFDITVKLNGNPYEGVPVDVTLMDRSSSDLSITVPLLAGGKRRLTFTTDNWNDPQTITVHAAIDPGYQLDSGTLVLMPQGTATDASRAEQVTVNVNDPQARNLVVSPTRIETNEGATRIAVNVELDGNPYENVTVTATVDNSDVTLVGFPHTFNGSNWGTDHTLSISVAEDMDPLNETATITLAATGTATSDTENVVVSIIDVTPPPVLVVNPTDITMNEGAAPRNITVKLSGNPYEEVPVNITWAALSSGDLSVTGGRLVNEMRRLTFNRGNWNTLQTVTVHAATDSGYQFDSGVLELTPQGVATNASRAEEVTVNVNDPQARDLVVSSSPIEMDEGTTRSITVKLTGDPYENVPVDVALGNGSSSDLLITAPSLMSGKRSLSFDSSNWNTPQTIIIRAATDSDHQNDIGTLVLTPGGFATNASRVGSVPINVIDPLPVRHLVISSASVTMNEGARHSITVRLDGNPYENVPVDLTWNIGSSGDLSITGTHRLSFNSSNWNDPQPVTVYAAIDSDYLSDEGVLVLTPKGTATNRKKNVSINVVDRPCDASVSSNHINMNEGASSSIALRLDCNPRRDVHIDVTLAVGSSSDLSITSPSSVGGTRRLTFNSSNWNTPQTITVQTAIDSDYQSDSGTLVLTPGATTGTSRARSVPISIVEPPRLVISPTSVTMSEGTTRSISVKLDGNPSESASVDATLKSGYSSDLSITAPSLVGGKRSLTFNSSNWNDPQTIAVRAAADSDYLSDRGTLVLIPGSFSINASLEQSVSIRVTDPPPPPPPPPPSEYTISVYSSNSQYGYTIGGGTFRRGIRVTVRAVEQQNGEFYGWYENGSRVSLRASYTFTVNSSRTLQARFRGGSHDCTSQTIRSDHGEWTQCP